MKIAVVGSGPVGRALAGGWTAAGHQVVFAARDPQRTQESVREIDGAEVVEIGAGLHSADVVVLAVPGGAAVADVVASHGAALDGKVVVDATNRLDGSTGSPNSIDEIRRHAPGALPVRAFNSVGWEVFAGPDFDGVQADLLWCGPDATVPAAEKLIGDLGLRPVRVGGLDTLPQVDGLAALWFALALHGGRGRHLAFKILTTPDS
ncbi:NADPH-dependent F420 reductase [Streptomyces sp. NPDC020490]|uniref:NADPH-dependent F420 reductase n=1 Tax=Streptomyces sp. NPDC020490 TaxID=3365078 RepID=UPI003796CF9F